MSGAVALPRTVADLVEEHDRKAAAIEEEIAAFEAAWTRLDMATTVLGTVVESLGGRPHFHASALRKNLLKSGWKAIYNRLQIDRIASAKDKQLFERAIADPPPLTIDNAKATFGDYFVRPRYHILRALAEAFVDLDPAYKSHSKVRIGVQGLPKRVILKGWGYSGWSKDKFRDICNALATYQGKLHIEWCEIQDVEAQHRAGEDAVMNGRKLKRYAAGAGEQEWIAPDRGITVRGFANGNAHIIFDKWTLIDINKALAEFYGEVLPDAEEEDVKPSASTAVSKDLQFYWTPPEVVDAALEFAGVPNPANYSRYGAGPPCCRVLEPSCGDGRILDAVRARGHRALGIEYHPGRAAEAKAKGHNVLTGNFLEQPATPDFDYVVMNPPFYGRHYAKHVRHAEKFLKPGGTLVSILPATAHYDHGELKGEWRDLPVGSFSAAGTNVPTGLLRITRRAA
ncbi:DUF4942 domain-containing protein [Sphingomonas sp.]|uniref:DUF4942 domain-containing protein n=1 Tax=Sphingomonas sp. TaxID=28214 RepID=UPI003B3BDF46